MQIFIDSANPEEIKTAMEWGIVDGVTTNPTLATKAGVKFREAVEEILQLVKGPVSLEVVSTEYKNMVEEGRKLVELGEQVVVKLPTTTDGLKALRELSEGSIKVNMTLVFSPTQALLVGKLGATYVSPFIGRVDDISYHGGDELVAEMVEIYKNYNFETQILAASIRDVEHVAMAARLGADVCTVPFDVLGQLVKHKLTDAGLGRFLQDWEASGQESLV